MEDGGRKATCKQAMGDYVRMGKGNVLKSDAVVPIQQRDKEKQRRRRDDRSTMTGKKTSTGLRMSSWGKVVYSHSSKW